MENLKAIVGQLAESRMASISSTAYQDKWEARFEGKKKQFWHELKILKNNVPQSEWEQGQLLWLALNHFCFLPGKLHDEEVNHNFGTVKALAAGISKSKLYEQPMLEIHATACPSYLNGSDWNTLGKETGIYVYQNIKAEKLAALKEFAASLSGFGAYLKGVYLHTPAPQDLQSCGDLSACFGIFNQGEAGKNSMGIHWQQMNKIISQLPGFSLQPDVSYISQYMNPNFFDQFMKTDLGRAAWESFNKSTYINDAYKQWGVPVEAALKAFYLGTIFAYGNHQSAFNPQNQQALKLYLNLEEKQSPYTFAGQSTGVDFRHLLADYGYHLPLLIGQWAINSPWAER